MAQPLRRIFNPPYQEDDGGAAASASPVYQYFVEGAKSLDPEKIVLITPSRWFVGGKGLDEFRNEMLNDKHLAEIHDWLTPQDVFPTTNIRGGYRSSSGIRKRTTRKNWRVS